MSSEGKMKDEKVKNGTIKKWIPYVLIAAIVAYIIFLFAFRKEGFHSDEPWSYGYSNGYYTGLFYEDDEGNDLHLYEWIKPDIFEDYLTVSKDHRFAYDSVLYNLKRDKTVSPLYYFILHTICSFFPETFSWWYGFSINIVALIVFLFTLHALCKLISNNDTFSLICTGFIGFSTGMQSCFIYIRPYGFALMWVMLLLYFHMKMYKKGFQKVGKELIGILIITLMGGLTQSFFYLIAFFMAAFTDFYLLFSKKWKMIVAYSSSMLIAVAGSYIVWPYPFKFTSSIEPEKIYPNKLPYIEELRRIGPLFGGESIGIPFYFPTRFSNAIALGVIAVLGMLLVAIIFLARKEPWYLELKKSMPAKWKNFKEKIKEFLKNCNKMLWIIVLAMDASFAINIRYQAGYMNMSVWVDRYFFFLMPVFAMVFWYAIYSIVKCFKKKKTVAKCLGVILFAGLFLSNQVAFSSNYFFETESANGIGLENAVRGKDVVLVVDSTWEMVYYAVALRNANEILIMRNEEVMTTSFENLDKDTKNACLVCQVNYLRDDTAQPPEEFSAEYMIQVLRTYEFSEEELLGRLLDFSFINQFEFKEGLVLYTGLAHIFDIH